MNKCIKCGSYAFNLYKDGIDQGGMCDVHYWQGRANRAEALAKQPAQQEPVEYWNAVEGWVKIDEVREHFDSVGCGTIYKTPGDGRVPLTTAQRTWVGLTEPERLACYDLNPARFASAIEAKLKEKNT